MQKLVLALGLVALVALGSTMITKDNQQNNFRGSGAKLTAEVIQQWKEFKKSHPRTFTDPSYEVYRMQIFANNLQKINTVNSSNKSYTLGVNQFADMTPEEFSKAVLGFKPELKTKQNKFHVNNGLTVDSIDWREKGAVQAIKNQGQCGSCWAFSAVGSLESEDFVHGSGLGNFSEQQLVDCSRSYGNMGCNGGLMDYAFEFVIDHGITSEDSYPYTARDGTCKQQSGDYQIKSYTDVKSGSTDDLQNAITQQPTSVAVDAMQWQFYSGGVFSDCETSLDHGVLAVGFTDEYWIIKNSWGTTWGEDGYIRLATGNTCGLANMASYPSL